MTCLWQPRNMYPVCELVPTMISISDLILIPTFGSIPILVLIPFLISIPILKNDHTAGINRG